MYKYIYRQFDCCWLVWLTVVPTSFESVRHADVWVPTLQNKVFFSHHSVKYLCSSKTTVIVFEIYNECTKSYKNFKLTPTIFFSYFRLQKNTLCLIWEQAVVCELCKNVRLLLKSTTTFHYNGLLYSVGTLVEPNQMYLYLKYEFIYT